VGEARGRGAAYVFENEGRRFVLRHYCRGGLIAKAIHDQYLWLGEARTRPLREMRITFDMHADGLPVPLPVAVRYERDGLAYRGDIITEYLPDTQSLAQCLDAGEVSFTGWAAIGRCLRRFHDYGLCHADLNAHNILLRGDEIYLIDFDRGTRRSPGMWSDANLVRLRRSLEKLEDQRQEVRFNEAQWHCLLSAYF
jgi:3-deoxy-D-manno-octulosonic acid kinase